MLDNRLTFNERLQNVSNKTSKIHMFLLWKIQNILRRSVLLTIYKCFIRPHLDYGNSFYDQAYNLSFHEKSTALALTGAITGSSREKLYQELGLESLQLRQWHRKLCWFNKIYNKLAPDYLIELIPTRNEAYQTMQVANALSLVLHVIF